jgi:Mg-chelatase subunit ChlI
VSDHARILAAVLDHERVVNGCTCDPDVTLRVDGDFYARATLNHDAWCPARHAPGALFSIPDEADR